MYILKMRRHYDIYAFSYSKYNLIHFVMQKQCQLFNAQKQQTLPFLT